MPCSFFNPIGEEIDSPSLAERAYLERWRSVSSPRPVLLPRTCYPVSILPLRPRVIKEQEEEEEEEVEEEEEE